MCGIVGYVGQKDCADLLVSGLRRLEYRGYDSAGLATLGPSGLEVARAQGKLVNLADRLKAQPLHGVTGIGHTRWATHGRPNEVNAHPHAFHGVAVVHNGIVENHRELRAALAARGHAFGSETDSEVLAHLVADALDGGATSLAAAVRQALQAVKGSYALAVVSERRPGEIVAAKNASPLVVGLGRGETLLASDVTALLDHTRDVVVLEEGEVAVLTAGGVAVTGAGGEVVDRPARRVEWSNEAAEKDGHRHFMHKEIFEQPRAVAGTLRGRIAPTLDDVLFDGLEAPLATSIDRVVVVACGTSWHAGLAGKRMIQALSRLPVEVELASEFRQAAPVIDRRTLCIAVSQSGETADTLAALKEARGLGARTLAICNVVGSALTRECEATITTQAGPEIGVASTKAFTTQLAAFALLAVWLGRRRGVLDGAGAREVLEPLRRIPGQLEELLGREPQVMPVARRCAKARDVLFLGRGHQHAVALEGALKLKEISYIHAEGYAAGELKHGPIALLDEHLPVVALAVDEPSLEKTLSNLEEVKARGAPVFGVVTEGDLRAAELCEVALPVGRTHPLLASILTTVPLQLLAYHTAVLKGTDVDQPRNLAKSVTVE